MPPNYAYWYLNLPPDMHNTWIPYWPSRIHKHYYIYDDNETNPESSACQACHANNIGQLERYECGVIRDNAREEEKSEDTTPC